MSEGPDLLALLLERKREKLDLRRVNPVRSMIKVKTGRKSGRQADMIAAQGSTTVQTMTSGRMSTNKRG